MEMALVILLVFTAIALWIRHKSKQNQWTDWGHPTLNFFDGLNRWFARSFHRLKVDHIPLIHDPDTYTKSDGSKQGVVWVCNHLSGVDPFLMVAASKRPVRFLIAREQYERKELHWLLKRIKFIPVDRAGVAKKSNSRSVLREASHALANGEVICIFPQGGIVGKGSKGSLNRLKKGAFHLAQECQVPLVVSSITGIDGFGLEAGALLKRSHAHIHFHKTFAMAEGANITAELNETTEYFVQAHESHVLASPSVNSNKSL